MSNTLEPNFNGLPKPTDWNKVIVPLQQANEKEMRGATLPELGEVMLKDKTINGQRMKAVPPGPLSAGPADQKMYMELLSEGSWTWNGVSVGTNPKGAILSLWWDTENWSKEDGVTLPADIRTKDWKASEVSDKNVIYNYGGYAYLAKESNSETPSVDSDFWEFLGVINSLYANKGKAYPFINQIDNVDLKLFNSILLDCKVVDGDFDKYNYSITSLFKGVNSGFEFARTEKSNNARGFLDLRQNSHNPADKNFVELEKLNLSGVQKIRIETPESWGGVVFELIMDVSAIGKSDYNFGRLSQANQWKSCVIIASNYSKSDFVRSKEYLNPFTISTGKDYPMVGYPSAIDSRVRKLKNVLLDAKIEVFDTSRIYNIGAFYRNHSARGYGINLTKYTEGINAFEQIFLTNKGNRVDNITLNSAIRLNDMSKGGIQTIRIDVAADKQLSLGIKSITITLNIDLLTVDNLDLISLDSSLDWSLNKFDPIAVTIVSDSQAMGIPSFKTFKDAVIAGQLGVIKVGSILAESKVSTVTFSGNYNQYYPSQVWKQYRTLNSSFDVSPNSSSQIMSVLDENGIECTIRGFSKRYIYFANNGISIYRTQDELKNNVNSKQNTAYDRIELPSILPDSVVDTLDNIKSVFELDNGELLIEVKNGITEAGSTLRRTQLYLTSGFKQLTPSFANGVNVYTIGVDKLSMVHQYKAGTDTQGKFGTTVSIRANKIALSPYGLGKVGLVHFSNDYGKTWKVIFNMGVEDPEFSVPYKDDIGAWPMAENLIPIMPDDMWTSGGNTNFHVHGAAIDLDGRIWVCTGDAGSNYQGRTALWYTDDDGATWIRMQTRGSGVLDSYAGIQPMGVVCTPNYILVGTDSPCDGLYRWSKTLKNEIPKLEAAYWYKDTFDNNMRVIFGGSVVTKEGYVYSVFHPNRPTRWDQGVVVFSADGVEFKEVYIDEISTGLANTPLLIDWGSFPFKDRYGNVYVSNENKKIIKLY